MIVFLKSDCSVAYRSYENINLGSNKANKLTVVAPFAPSSVVTAYITLPNGETLDPVVLANKGDAIKVVEDGENLSVWETEIDAYMTRVSGSLKIQLYISNDGATLTSPLITVDVNIGVRNVPTPPPPTESTYESIINYLNDSTNYIVEQKQEAEAAATEVKGAATESQKWATGSYVDENGETQNVTSEDPQFDNNAKYYANEASKSEASASKSKEEAEKAAANAAKSATNAKTSASTAENYLTELKSGIVEPLKKRVDNIDYILEQFGAVVEERDSSSALVKSVPARSDLYAYLSEIGGRTESFNQRLILPLFNNPSFGGMSTYFWQLAEGGSGTDSPEVSAVTKNGITMINNGDGSFTFRGTSTSTFEESFDLFAAHRAKSPFEYPEYIPKFSIDATKDSYLSFGGASLPSGVFVRVVRVDENDISAYQDIITGNGGAVTGSTYAKYLSNITINIPSGTVFNNFTIKLMLNDGTSAMPWQSPNEPFEGLRSAKVKEIKSIGVNRIPTPYRFANETHTVSGVNITVLSDGGLKLEGTSNGSEGYYELMVADTFLPFDNDIKAQIFTNNTASLLLQVKRYNAEGTNVGDYNTSASTGKADIKVANYPDSVKFRVRLMFKKNTTVTYNEIVYPMISYGTATPSYYPPRNDIVVSLPEAITNLPNYGEGNPNDPTEYNYVDGENGVYIRRGGIVDGAWVSETPTTTPINFDPLIPVEASGSIEVVTDNNQEVPTTFVYNIIQEA